MCQNYNLPISCAANKKISIKYGMFGRVSQAKCRSQYILSDNCMSNLNNTLSTIKKICDLKSKCTVPVTQKVFGNPCSGIYKYLDVKYQCV